MNQTNKTKQFENAVIVASNERYQWLIPWWFYLYKQNNNYPVIFCDFVEYGGMTQGAIEFCKKYGTYIRIEGKRKHIWLMKPLALLNSPSKNIVWTDLDCQIKGNLAPIFKYCNNFGCCKERNIRKLPNGERLWGEWQGGVIATNTSSPILEKWNEECLTTESVIDQYALTQACKKNSFTIDVMPNLFNWTTRMGYNENCLIKHWTGPSKRKFKIIRTQKNVGFDYNFSSIVVDLAGGIRV